MTKSKYCIGMTQCIEADQILLPARLGDRQRTLRIDHPDPGFSIDRETLHRIDLNIIAMFQDACFTKHQDNIHPIKRDHIVEQSRRLAGSLSSKGTRHHPAATSKTNAVMAQVRDSEEKDTKKTAADGSILLPLDFKPLPYSVIVGKGKISRNVIGNRRLRVLASNYLTKYDETSTNRDTKSEIVSTIIRTIRAACPLGPFIKRGKDGRWYEVNENVAREKVGYTFRDLLGTKYKSSSKAKQAMRRLQKYGML